jgi:hypothetical protein
VLNGNCSILPLSKLKSQSGRTVSSKLPAEGADFLYYNQMKQSLFGLVQVNNDDEVRALFKQVQGEVPGSPIFIMKLAAQVH